jgi:hypothetical protein
MRRAPTTTTTTWAGMAIAVGLAMATLGCGDGGPDSTRSPDTSTDTSTGSEAASPFLVDAIPERVHLVTAGEGTGQQDWGSDSVGTHEPFTVLAPEGGSAAGDDLVVVSVTGFEGYQGGLAQASAGYGRDPDAFDLDGRDAIYTPADGDRWADLVVDRGDDVAVRVTAADAGRDDLVAVAERVQPDADRGRAPAVPDPPDGVAVVGSVDAAVVASVRSYVDAGTVPGTGDAFGAGWTTGAPVAPADPAQGPPGSAELTVVAHPGDMADLDALPGIAAFGLYRDATVSSVTVDGRAAALVEQIMPSVYANESPKVERALFAAAPWGDLLIAGTSGDLAAAATVDELVAALGSARQATPQEWEAFVATASAGPG